MSGAIRLALLISVVLLCWFIGTGSLRASPPYVNGTGYIDNHLVGFRKHVNSVRAHKCMGRYPYKMSDRELSSLDLGSAQRRFVRLIWKVRHWRAHAAPSRCTPWYVTAQIRAGNILGRESAGDPWPNCPDPWDGSGASWQGTVNCENGGRWLDSPGFYRCGLQFHPNWENRFGETVPVRILTATMVALVTLGMSALLVSVVQDEQAEAAVSYCGHNYKTYIRSLPSGAVVFRISYAWSSTSSQHVHHYRIFRRRDLGYTVKWVYVTSLDRVCLNTHPV